MSGQTRDTRVPTGGHRRTFLATATAAVLAAAALVGSSPAFAGATTVGLPGWRVQSSALAAAGGGEISQPGFSAGSWLRVKPDDAGAVGTEVGALVQNGKCPH